MSFPIISATNLLRENLFFLASWRSDGQPGSYQLARWVGTDKRASRKLTRSALLTGYDRFSVGST
jgi:hypothetical protein